LKVPNYRWKCQNNELKYQLFTIFYNKHFKFPIQMNGIWKVVSCLLLNEPINHCFSVFNPRIFWGIQRLRRNQVKFFRECFLVFNQSFKCKRKHHKWAFVKKVKCCMNLLDLFKKLHNIKRWWNVLTCTNPT